MKTIRIALAQINPVMGDFQGNIRKVIAQVEAVKAAGLDFVVFPEMVLCGYPPEDLLHRQGFVAETEAALDQVAYSTKHMTAVVGYAYQQEDKVYNAAALLHDAENVAVYNKIELPNYGVFDEKRYFSPGTKPLIFVYAGVRMAVTICEDIWIEEGQVQYFLREQQVDVILNLSASPFHAGKIEQRIQRLTQTAKKTKAYVCYVNLVGGQDELVFDGGSMALTPTGEILAAGARFQETLLVTEIQLAAPKTHSQFPAAVVISSESKSELPEKIVCNPKLPQLSRLEEVYAALIMGTRDYVHKNGFSKVVLGLSGGIDSALVAALAVTALGAENVIAVTMPSEISSAETRADAELQAKQLGIRFMTIPINPMLAAFVESLQDAFGPGEPGIEHENLQARIRGNILMALSNRFGWLVLTTGNKSETAVGYCTLYGDMAGGFAVIKDVPKTLVYALADFINAKAPGKRIVQSIIDRPPTAELRPNQKDQDSLPPYAQLDEIIKAYVEEDRDPSEIKKMGFALEIISQSVRLVDRSEYKRRQAPPGVKITPKAFGRDRRLPLTNRYQSGFSK
ncbi:NAD+ synthase [bacterium]|nr:NAD+ synthase [bacterium]